MKRKSSRRDFLRGQSAADAMADTLRDAIPPNQDGGRRQSGRQPEREGYLIHVSRRAMACEFEVRLNAGQYEQGTETALEVLDAVDALEEQLSIFRETSDVARINRTAAEGPVEVESGLFSLLQLAAQLYDRTDGAFDLTSTPLWEAWGFAQRSGRLPGDEQIARAMADVGSRFVQLDAENRTVRFLRPGIRLNLGSIGKGHALDVCAETLREAGIEHFLLHGGQSSVLARGSRAGRHGDMPEGAEAGWSVGVRHPLRPDRRLAEIRLRDRALATSGSWAQSFVVEGRRYGHILDPRTGRPAEGVLSATVLAPTATLADALSTAFFVMGPEEASRYCKDHPELAAVLVCPVRHSGGIEVRGIGLDEDEWTLL